MVGFHRDRRSRVRFYNPIHQISYPIHALNWKYTVLAQSNQVSSRLTTINKFIGEQQLLHKMRLMA